LILATNSQTDSGLSMLAEAPMVDDKVVLGWIF